MAAFALTVGLFGFWTVLGLAAVSFLYVRRAALLAVLLAPCVGMALSVLLVFLLNRLGMPVESFGRPLAVALLGVAVFLLLRRVGVPWPKYAPFAGIFLVGLLLAGWPLLQFGFDWVSYCNDDMANYCLAAQRFQRYGFYDKPTEDLAAGRDYSQYYYLYHVTFPVRPGSELLLAWVASVTGLTTLQVFMPVVLSFHVTLLSATGALMGRTRRTRALALATCGLLSVSALATLGVVYQLIAQTAGLALLAATFTTLLGPLGRMRASRILRHGLLLGILGGGLLILYPEVSVFLAVAVVVHFAVRAWYGQARLGRVVPGIVVATAFVVVFYNSYAFRIAEYLSLQFAAQSETNRLAFAASFPYYLMPTGAANLWGVFRISEVPREPWLSLGILLGSVLCVLGLLAVAWMTWRRQPAAAVALVMIGVAALLFWKREGFGLFKLAMFVQPFLAGAVAAAWFRLTRHRGVHVRVLPLVLLGLVGVLSQWRYVEASRGTGQHFTEIPGASRHRIGQSFAAVVEEAAPSRLLLETDNIVLAKVQAMFTRGIPTTYLSDVYFQGLREAVPENLPAGIVQRHGRFYREFDLHDGRRNLIHDPYPPHEPPSTWESAHLIGGSGQITVLNRQHARRGGPLFFQSAVRDLRNHLVFVSSDLGQTSALARDPSKVGIWRIEPEPRMRKSWFAAFGRCQAFQVFGPTPTFRMVLDMTVSHRGDGELILPKPSVIGDARRTIPFVGRGSGRVFSEPVSPQLIAGRAYLMLDFDQDLVRLEQASTGLMRLAGENVQLDRRSLVGWVRNVSLVSEEEYAALEAPSSLEKLPGDLLQAGLEYSGITEDGWVSDQSFFCLRQTSSHGAVVLRGHIPQAQSTPPFQTELTVRLDGEVVGRADLGVGDFEQRFTVPRADARRRIELTFSRTQRLPAPDRRPVGARISSIGFAGTNPGSP